MGELVELGYSALTRRERLERIAMAERDRRAGRIEVAIAALGEASEWPALAVLALAKRAESEAPETRRILEEGLDSWVADVGLTPFDQPQDTSPVLPGHELDRPIDHAELEQAFAEAEAQTDEMHSANHVAERVLMEEPVGLAELDGGMLLSTEDEVAVPMDAASVEDPTTQDSSPSRPQILAVLEGWLQNLERSSTRRAQ